VLLPYLDEELERALQPWEERPCQLVSWFEMLHFSAGSFFWCGSSLRGIRQDCAIGSVRCIGNEPVFVVVASLDDKARDKAVSSLKNVEIEFRKIGLTISADTSKELYQELESGPQHNFQWLIDQVVAIEKLCAKELKGKMFLYVPPERAKFWPKQESPHAFGEEVRLRFSSAAFDVHSAAICLATTQSTASVFHLMRVLEVGLIVLGKAFGVSLAHTNWGPAIEQIENKIRDIHKDPIWKAQPDYKEQQEFYAQAASNFAILKDAWRNYTMHARGKYTQEEAEMIFGNTKAFMQKLAERLKE
jgi:hypothetical protein